MSFLSGLLSYENGQGKGQHDAYLNALAQDDAQKAFIVAQQRWDAEHADDKAKSDRETWRYSREQQDAAETDRLKGLKPPATLAHPLNHGKAPTNEQLAQNELNLANWYDSQNDTVRAAEHRENARQYSTLASNDTRSTLGQGRLVLDATKDANLRAYRNNTMAQRRSMFDQNQQRLAANYAASYMQRGELAQLSHADRLYVANLGGLIRLQVANDGDVLRTALEQFRQSNENYRMLANPRNALLTGDGGALPGSLQSSQLQPPQFQPPQYQPASFPPINIYTGGGAPNAPVFPGTPASGGNNAPAQPARSPFARNSASAKPQGGSAPAGLSGMGRTEYESAKAVLSNGAPLAAIVARVRERGPKEGLSSAEIEAIIKALGGGASPQTRTPATTPAGLELKVPGLSAPTTPFGQYGRGSSAATPFPGQ